MGKQKATFTVLHRDAGRAGEAARPAPPPPPAAPRGRRTARPGWPLPPGGPDQVSPPPPGPSSPPPLRAGPRMVRSARELGAGLAGDARALWPNTARSESKLPAQCVCVRAGVRARVCERVSERARGGGAANCFTLSILHRRGRARQPGDAHIPPRSPQANVPQITGQNPPNRNGGNGQPLNMDEGIPHLQERQLLEHRDFIG